MEGFLRDRDQLASVRRSTPNPYLLHAEAPPHDLPHVDDKPVHPVMNGELNGPPLGLNYPRSPPSLLSGEGMITLFSRQYP
jgi:hypothetical protein